MAAGRDAEAQTGTLPVENSATVDGYFFALDADTGEELWHIPLGGPVNANPMTYAVDGAQYVTLAVGNTVYTFGLDE